MPLPRVTSYPILGEHHVMTKAGGALVIPAKERKKHPLLNKYAPEIKLPDHQGNIISLHSTLALGRPICLYFYPLAGSPHCTQQSCNLRDALYSPLFEDLGVIVIGVSQDPPQRAKKFKEHHNINFCLLSDTTRQAFNTYHVGHILLGLVNSRCTFIIDHLGIVRAVLEGVWDARGHRKFAERWLARIAGELAGRPRQKVEFQSLAGDLAIPHGSVASSYKVLYDEPDDVGAAASSPSLPPLPAHQASASVSHGKHAMDLAHFGTEHRLRQSVVVNDQSGPSGGAVRVSRARLNGLGHRHTPSLPSIPAKGGPDLFPDSRQISSPSIIRKKRPSTANSPFNFAAYRQDQAPAFTSTYDSVSSGPLTEHHHHHHAPSMTPSRKASNNALRARLKGISMRRFSSGHASASDHREGGSGDKKSHHHHASSSSSARKMVSNIDLASAARARAYHDHDHEALLQPAGGRRKRYRYGLGVGAGGGDPAIMAGDASLSSDAAPVPFAANVTPSTAHLANPARSLATSSPSGSNGRKSGKKVKGDMGVGEKGEDVAHWANGQGQGGGGGGAGPLTSVVLAENAARRQQHGVSASDSANSGTTTTSSLDGASTLEGIPSAGGVSAEWRLPGGSELTLSPANQATFKGSGGHNDALLLLQQQQQFGLGLGLKRNAAANMSIDVTEAQKLGPGSLSSASPHLLALRHELPASVIHSPLRDLELWEVDALTALGQSQSESEEYHDAVGYGWEWERSGVGGGASQAGSSAYVPSLRDSLGIDEGDRVHKPSSIAASAPILHSSAATLTSRRGSRAASVAGAGGCGMDSPASTQTTTGTPNLNAHGRPTMGGTDTTSFWPTALTPAPRSRKTSKPRIGNSADEALPHSPGGAVSSSRSGQLLGAGAGAAEAKGSAAMSSRGLRAAGGGMDRILDVREGHGTLRARASYNDVVGGSSAGVGRHANKSGALGRSVMLARANSSSQYRRNGGLSRQPVEDLTASFSAEDDEAEEDNDDFERAEAGEVNVASRSPFGRGGAGRAGGDPMRAGMTAAAAAATSDQEADAMSIFSGFPTPPPLHRNPDSQDEGGRAPSAWSSTTRSVVLPSEEQTPSSSSSSKRRGSGSSTTSLSSGMKNLILPSRRGSNGTPTEAATMLQQDAESGSDSTAGPKRSTPASSYKAAGVGTGPSTPKVPSVTRPLVPLSPADMRFDGAHLRRAQQARMT